MIYRFDQITVDFPESKGPNPQGAAAVQELLGGKFGEMSTLMNYTFQSFNFRGRKHYKPFYDLISNIAAEEYSHIETVICAITRCSPARRRATTVTTSMTTDRRTPLRSSRRVTTGCRPITAPAPRR